MQLLVFLVIIAILAGIELIFYRRHALDQISLDVHFSQPVASYGEVIEVIEIAQNSKKLPLPFLLLKFESPVALEFLDMTNTSLSDLLYREDMLTMKPYSRHTRKIKARCIRRGYYSFFRVNVSTTDLLLIDKITKDYENEAIITILPERVEIGEIKTLLSITFSDVLQRRSLLTDPFAFAGIREYQPWDPMRSINWTASAKAGDLMVNQNASTSTRQVSIFVNLEFYNTKSSTSLLEKAIALAYSYMFELCQAGISSSLYTNGLDILANTPVTSDMSCSMTDMSQRGIELARIDLSKGVIPFQELVEENIAKTNDDDFIVVISPRSDANFQTILDHFRTRRKSVLWVMPCYRTTARITPTHSAPSEYLRWETLGHD
ncbi:MAG: DUF58 domain-containing protein [Clostridiales bacterium]|nr:DUF58 domain-containing protein [Clostridiales bacterium]